MRAILEFDAPEKCRDCRLLYIENGRGYCQALIDWEGISECRKEIINMFEHPLFCPLKIVDTDYQRDLMLGIHQEMLALSQSGEEIQKSTVIDWFNTIKECWPLYLEVEE